MTYTLDLPIQSAVDWIDGKLTCAVIAAHWGVLLFEIVCLIKTPIYKTISTFITEKYPNYHRKYYQ